MQISIPGHQLDVGDALKVHVEDRLVDGVKKYFENAIDVEVVFSKENAYLFKADIIVNDGTGTHGLTKGTGQADEVYAAFDLAADRIEKQLRRLKRKLKNHHKKKLDFA